MLNPDPKKLRFLGIDLHSRVRRRCAVVLSIGAFMIAMLALSVATDDSAALQRYHLGFWLMALLTCFGSVGIFREGGPVKSFHEPLWRLKGMAGGAVLVRGLDDRAEYRFGRPFDALTDAEQSEILGRYRVGNYFFPAAHSKASSRLNERERIEKDRACSATLIVLRRYLFVMAVLCGFGRNHFAPADMGALLFTLAFVGLNGPKAAILWNEPSPGSGGELPLLRESEGGTAGS